MSQTIQRDVGNPSGQKHIVVVNDSEDLLDLIKTVLEEGGHETTILHASDGAYKKIKELQPALLILDIVMEQPDSGWQLLQILKLDTQTSEIPVIICSADSRFLHANEERLQRLGCYILPKPFDIDELLQLVNLAMTAEAL